MLMLFAAFIGPRRATERLLMNVTTNHQIHSGPFPSECQWALRPQDKSTETHKDREIIYRKGFGAHS